MVRPIVPPMDLIVRMNATATTLNVTLTVDVNFVVATFLRANVYPSHRNVMVTMIVAMAAMSKIVHAPAIRIVSHARRSANAFRLLKSAMDEPNVVMEPMN